jgi:hypothetical protein
MSDQFAWWRAALDAQKKGLTYPDRPDDLHVTEVGTPGHRPPCGYYRKPNWRGSGLTGSWEAIAFYPDPSTGEIVCERQSGKFMPTTLDAMAELFASRCEPVEFKIYEAVVDRGEPWPDDVDAFGLPPLDDAPENPDAVPGHNRPPEKTEAEKAALGVELAENTAEEWLKAHPDITKLSITEGDYLSRLAARVRELKQAHEKRRKELVAPHLKAQNDINGAWNPIVARAETLTKKLLNYWDTWRGAKQREAEAEARRINEAAQKAADEQRARLVEESPDAALAMSEPEPVVTLVQPVKIKGATGTRISSRSRTAFVIEDLPKLAAHIAGLESPPADFVQACQAFANKFGAAGNLPGVRQDKQSHVA